MSLPPEDVQRVLQSVLDHLEETKNFRTQEILYQALIDKLNTIAKHTPPWSSKYIYNTLKIPGFASEEFRNALEIFTATLDGQSILQARAKIVQVVTLTPFDHQNVQIYGTPQLCEKSNCIAWFVSNNPSRKYCYTCSPPKGDDL